MDNNFAKIREELSGFRFYMKAELDGLNTKKEHGRSVGLN